MKQGQEKSVRTMRIRNVGPKGHLEPFYSRGCTCVDSFQCWEGHQKGTTIRRKSLDYPRDTIISFVTWCVCLRYHSLSAFREMESQGKKCVMLSFFSYLHKCLGTGAWIEDDKKYLYLTLECTAILTYICLWGVSILEIPFKNHRKAFCDGQSLLELFSCSTNLQPRTSRTPLLVLP